MAIKTKPHCSDAQKAFRKKVRDEIDAGTCAAFNSGNWKEIRPTRSGQIGPTYYDVKYIACFVPHLILPNYRPWCPNCESPCRVDMTKTRWLGSPKPLFDMGKEGELDSVRYLCCPVVGKPHTFVAYNPKSLKLGGYQLVGMFRFYVSVRFAVTEQLHHFVVSSMYDPVASISRKLASMVIRKYVSDMIEYYSSAARGEVKTVKNGRVSVTRHDMSQTTLVHQRQERVINVQHNELVREYNNAKSALMKLRGQCENAQHKFDDPIELSSLLKVKSNKKNSSQRIAGLGPEKIKDLLQSGFKTAQEFRQVWIEDPT